MDLSVPHHSASQAVAPEGDAVRWWEWPTVLSLDAPLVAVCWQALFARMAGVTPDTGHMLMLGGCVWLIYAADRWIDGWRLRDGQTATQRHRFYARHRWKILPLWLAVFVAGSVSVWTVLSAAQLRAGFALAGLAGAYVVIHQGIHRSRLSGLPKEVLAASIFAAGCALCPGTTAVVDHALGFFPAVVLFACLCFSNIVMIASWEKEVDRAQGNPSLALQWRSAGAAARYVALLVVVMAVAMFLYDHGRTHGAFLALGASALLLLGVDALEPRFGSRAARVIADAVLLVPLLIFLRL